MAVFYKYVERQVSDQINWADISKSLSQTFDAEREAREKKKAEIDQASLEYVEKLQSQPETESANLNSRMSQFITDASSLQKSNLDDLKQGRITLRDYTLRTQNLKSDSVAALDSIQTYGKRYSEVMKGIKDGDLSAAQADFMARFEGFANLANNRLYVEPTTGRVFVANEVIDPVTGVKKMGDNIQNMASLKNMMEQDIPRMNLDADLNTRVDKLGGFITSTLKSGGLYQIGNEFKFEDATEQQYYDKYLTDLTEELAGGASNPNAVSFFVDNMKVAPNGQPYKVVFSEEDRKNPNDLLMKQGAGGVYFAEPTKEQMKDAEEHIKIQMRQKIKQATTANAFVIPEKSDAKSEREAKEKAQKEKDVKSINMISKFYQGDPTGMAAAETYFKGLDPNIVKIDKTDNGLNVMMKDGRIIPIPMVVNGRRLSGTDFIKSATFLTKVSNVDEALKLSEFDPKKPFNSSTYSGAETRTKAPDYNTQVTLKTPDGKEITIGSPSELYKQTVTGTDKAQGRVDFASQILMKLGNTIDATQIDASKVGSILTKDGKKIPISSLGGGKSINATYIKIPNYGDIIIPSHIPDDQAQQIIKTIYQNVSEGKRFDPADLRLIFPEYDTYNSFFRGSNTGKSVQRGVATSSGGGGTGAKLNNLQQK